MAPAMIYLTHYGALRYSQENQHSLLQQIDDYVVFAQQYQGDAARLEEALMDFSQRQVEEMNGGAKMHTMRERFRHDAQLNAQGLAVWMQRQAS
jgi:hypothetical protein